MGVWEHSLHRRKLYNKIYPLYRSLCERDGTPAATMRKLRELAAHAGR